MNNEKTNAKGETMILNIFSFLMELKTSNKEAMVYNNTANHWRPLNRSIDEKSIKGEMAESINV
jgi:hypothetical protein